MSMLLTETVRIITVLISAWNIHAEKIHFARYIDTERDPFTYRLHAIVIENVAKCVEYCKSSNECKYINYHVASHVCYLIGETAKHHVDIADRVEKKKGYVFGKKTDWTLKTDSGCLVCKGDGTCVVDSTQINTCPVSGCKPPETKPNAVAMGNMFAVGNRVKYECLGNRIITGAKQNIAECLSDGTWSVTDFKCLFDCASPPNIQNGLATFDDINSTVEGATATVICNPGHQHDLPTITCLNTGKWQIPTCTIKECGLTPSVSHGNVNLNPPGNNIVGATATVTCTPGYAPEKSTIACQPSGVWEFPQCKGPIFTCTGRSTKLAVSDACDTCLTECVDGADEMICACTEALQRFISLPNYRMLGYNIEARTNVETDVDCMVLCRSTNGCKSAEYFRKAKKCQLNKLMPFEKEPSQHAKTDLLLRQCDACHIIRK